MKIGYKKRHLNGQLILGIVWLVLGLLGIFANSDPYWTFYVFLAFSLIYLTRYFYKKQNKYLKIENGVITENSNFGKKINLSEIIQIKKFAGDYILKTEKTELSIATQIIDEKSLEELNIILDNLNIETT